MEGGERRGGSARRREARSLKRLEIQLRLAGLSAAYQSTRKALTETLESGGSEFRRSIVAPPQLLLLIAPPVSACPPQSHSSPFSMISSNLAAPAALPLARSPRPSSSSASLTPEPSNPYVAGWRAQMKTYSSSVVPGVVDEGCEAPRRVQVVVGWAGEGEEV